MRSCSFSLVALIWFYTFLLIFYWVAFIGLLALDGFLCRSLGGFLCVKTLPILQFVVSARLADIQKKQLDSVAREMAKQVARAAAVHLEARRLARGQVAGP